MRDIEKLTIYDKLKLDLLQHFTEHNYDVRINPNLSGLSTKYTPEEETILTMYIKEKIPYLNVYYSEFWKETMVTKKRKIPLEEKLFLYKHLYHHSKQDYYRVMDKLEKIIEGML